MYFTKAAIDKSTASQKSNCSVVCGPAKAQIGLRIQKAFAMRIRHIWRFIYLIWDAMSPTKLIYIKPGRKLTKTGFRVSWFKYNTRQKKKKTLITSLHAKLEIVQIYKTDILTP